MPETIFRVVLPLYAVLALGGLLVRRSLVRRRIGHDPVVIRPFRHSGAAASWLERVLVLAAIVSCLDIVLNAAAPAFVSSRLAVPLLRDLPVVGWTGLTLMMAGLLVCSVAIGHMGTSWRMGVDRDHPGDLVTRGIYHRVRHPIYSGLMLIVCGLAGVTADALSIAVAAAAFVGLPVQARLEEEFLAGRYGEVYAEYRQKTRRF